MKLLYGGLTLADHQVHTEALSESPSQQEKGTRGESSCVQIRTGKSLTNYYHGHNRYRWSSKGKGSTKARYLSLPPYKKVKIRLEMQLVSEEH